MTPDNTITICKTIFPLKGNEHLIDALVLEGHKLFVYEDIVLYEGTEGENDSMKTRLRGGVTAY